MLVKTRADQTDLSAVLLETVQRLIIPDLDWELPIDWGALFFTTIIYLALDSFTSPILLRMRELAFLFSLPLSLPASESLALHPNIHCHQQNRRAAFVLVLPSNSSTKCLCWLHFWAVVPSLWQDKKLPAWTVWKRWLQVTFALLSIAILVPMCEFKSIRW